MAISRSEEEPLVLGYNPSSLLFRVHDEKSATQLYEYNGFAATHPDFHSTAKEIPISDNVWQKTFQRDDYNINFLTQNMIQESIIKHVLGGWPGYAREYTGISDWISTSKSLEWAIWEIVRRLVKLNRPYVELTLINREEKSKNYRGTRMIYEDAAEAIDEYGYDYGLNEDQKMALRYAKASSEVLCFGRIFEKDIVATKVWTKSTPGISSSFDFMQAFFQTYKREIRQLD